MKLRPPAVPLITVDPYFSVWCEQDRLFSRPTVHWTGKPNTINGIVIVDGEPFRFMGDADDDMENPVQVSADVCALVTDYVFKTDKIVLSVSFYTPLLPDDLYRLSRPVSYLRACYTSADGQDHDVRLKIEASEELCIDRKGSEPVETDISETEDGLCSIRIGSTAQRVLNRKGDDLRIEWGYFYLAGGKEAKVSTDKKEDMTFIAIEQNMVADTPYTVLFAYDDIHCLEYFGEPVDAYWKKDGMTIGDAMTQAYAESDCMLAKCRAFSAELTEKASEAGGEKYAELLSLAFRQVIAAHKTAVDKNGEVIFISKECFSNGCAATVDVTYPSSPFFLLYNTELLKGMLRPIFRFASSEDWEFDFAPHDVGTYPLVNGQAYGRGSGRREEYVSRQMPVEECGNMIVMLANICLTDGNTDFADRYEEMTEKWVRYLIQYGADPENQLCTDDFAGHLAHNCNLSLKAIMGIEGYALMMKMRAKKEEYEKYHAIASQMADRWVRTAANDDGSFRLAFDRPDTFSMKYNIVWDKIWKTNLFPPCVFFAEYTSNLQHINPYGMPLDNRKDYTKSDWLVWTAMLAPDKEKFASFIEPLWNAYNVTFSRVPMTDWYDTMTATVIGFRHRSVQGGLYIRLLSK